MFVLFSVYALTVSIPLPAMKQAEKATIARIIIAKIVFIFNPFFYLTFI